MKLYHYVFRFEMLAEEKDWFPSLADVRQRLVQNTSWNMFNDPEAHDVKLILMPIFGFYTLETSAPREIPVLHAWSAQILKEIKLPYGKVLAGNTIIDRKISVSLELYSDDGGVTFQKYLAEEYAKKVTAYTQAKAIQIQIQKDQAVQAATHANIQVALDAAAPNGD